MRLLLNIERIIIFCFLFFVFFYLNYKQGIVNSKLYCGTFVVMV